MWPFSLFRDRIGDPPEYFRRSEMGVHKTNEIYYIVGGLMQTFGKEKLRTLIQQVINV